MDENEFVRRKQLGLIPEPDSMVETLTKILLK
jgi:hypothetical protein